ncbi:amidohydrolase family protein [Novosphingobium sp. Chol11]|uniref:N-acyl-D-amino-acid deacylase family protein n=1 Tax=Novosphingobium sp. Chol11 TaxID=1385763 RepID=UPI0025F8FF52|nr:amidohydrolase family protein [Novosphingobium sp. Chol11]
MRRPSMQRTGAFLLAFTTAAFTPAISLASTLITGATVYDGTGAAPRKVAVRVDGDRILAVGALKRRKGEAEIKAKGLALAPGFIDAHSHHDRGDYADRTMPPLLAQGVTTIVIGQDGESDGPFAQVAAKFAARPAAINVASYTGHGFLRDTVMGNDFKRTATPAEVKAMQALLAADIKAGSLGLATGLEYDPGIYSDHGELLDLAQTTATGGGRYISHMRSEDNRIDAALDELLDLGEKTGVPVQISHLKLAMVDRWGEAKKVLAKLEAARSAGIKVTADVYPYDYWQSTLTVLFPKRDFTDIAAARYALTKLTTPAGMRLGYYAPNPDFVGKAIADIAAERKEEPAATYLWLIQTAEAWRAAHPGQSVETVMGTSMAPGDIADFISWKHTSICSDGAIGSRHPRGYGAFPKVLRVYVREQRRLTLAEAVRKMTSLAADNAGLTERGRIRPGQKADLVLFDPARITDTATVENPNSLAQGVNKVMVNGALVWDQGKPTGATPGQFLKRGNL